MRKFLIGLSAILAVGCGGSGVNGTVVGSTLSVKDTIFALLKNDDGKSVGLLIAMSDQSGNCDKLKANRDPKNATTMLFVLVNRSDSAEPLAPDATDYTIKESVAGTDKGHLGEAYFAKTDANCTNTLQEKNTKGQSGLVKISKLDGSANGAANGTFDITMGTQLDKLTGSFSATYCDITKLQDDPSCE